MLRDWTGKAVKTEDRLRIVGIIDLSDVITWQSGLFFKGKWHGLS